MDNSVHMRSRLRLWSLIDGVTDAGNEEVVGSTRLLEVDEIDQDSRWTLTEYCPECRATMDVERFSTIAVDGNNLAMYVQNSFQWDTALAAWSRSWMVLRKWCARILINARFADMPLIWCEQEASYRRKLRDAIDARMKVEDADPRLQC